MYISVCVCVCVCVCIYIYISNASRVKASRELNSGIKRIKLTFNFYI